MADALSRTIASHIIKARERIGWSQADLSKQTGIGRVTLYRYEAGERRGIHVSNLIKIADATDVSVDFLLGRDGIAYRIKKARMAKKMTQQELADILGVSAVIVRRYETPVDNVIEQSSIADIANALGVSTEYLVGGFY